MALGTPEGGLGFGDRATYLEGDLAGPAAVVVGGHDPQHRVGVGMDEPTKLSRVLVALGGNAMIGRDGDASVVAQQAAVTRAVVGVAELVAAGHEVVLTHGNGPQVGNLLVKNELAAHAVPPVPLDWCVAQTQATIGFTIQNALEDALRQVGTVRPTVTVVTRTVVDAGDPGFATPTKPIGRHLPREQAQRLIDLGQTWEDRGPKGWRRIVASPPAATTT